MKLYTADWIVTPNIDVALKHRIKNPVSFTIKTKNGMFMTYPLGVVFVNDSETGNRIGFVDPANKTEMKEFTQ